MCAEKTSDKSPQGLNLKLLSWNLDGLDERELDLRTRSVIQFIKSHSPHVVFLQEVIPQTLAKIRDELGVDYSVHRKITFSYFPVILVTKRCPKLVLDGVVKVIDFPGSKMGRHLLQLFIKVCDVPIALYTSHLESMKDFSDERIRQLKCCFELMKEQGDLNGRTCIFGGDLNVRDSEVTEVGLPESIVDVWEYCGSHEEHKYTWDLRENDNKISPFRNKPKLRFDRLYFTAKNDDCFKPISFDLVGKKRIWNIGLYPSDHWGMFAEFELTV